MSRGALAALLFSAVPVVAPTAASAAGPAASMTVAADFGSPVYPKRGRYLLVDAASARLFMVEDGQVVDSMRVIVGKPEAQTPTISSKIYYATLNPYWNVPADLARKIIAPRVLKDGVSYLREHGYQVLASFDDGAPEISPEEVDWKAVAAGRATVKVRQLPGPGNSMGQVKFGFPNSHSIFLHDTPKKELFASDERAISNGCVRLEDAPKLARWLLGQDPQMVSAGIPEQHVALPRAVPIYITYLDQQPAELALAGGMNTVAR
jgi:L,D-transpeptidase YcbB